MAVAKIPAFGSQKAMYGEEESYLARNVALKRRRLALASMSENEAAYSIMAKMWQ